MLLKKEAALKVEKKLEMRKLIEEEIKRMKKNKMRQMVVEEEEEEEEDEQQQEYMEDDSYNEEMEVEVEQDCRKVFPGRKIDQSRLSMGPQRQGKFFLFNQLEPEDGS